MVGHVTNIPEDKNKVFFIIEIIIGSTSVVCGFINLLLIYFMKVWNPFILIITNLVISQLVFDLTVYLQFCDNSNNICISLLSFVNSYMSSVVTLWTNLIVTIVYYSTFIYFEISGIEDNFKIFFISFHLLGLLFGILVVIFLNTLSPFSYEVLVYVFFSLRLVSIAYNAILIGIIYYKIRDYEKSNPICELVKRLVFYPVVQIITFGSIAWYVFAYFQTDDDDYSSTTRFIMYIIL